MKLVIAEKPSVALSLAKVLGATKKHDGYLAGGGVLRTSVEARGSGAVRRELEKMDV